MAISTLAGLLAAVVQDVPFSKAAPGTFGAGIWVALWRLVGTPGAGTDPVSGVAGQTLTSADGGALPLVNPASGLTYLSRLSAQTSVAGQLVLYDRLWHNSGLSPTTLTSQTVNSVALPARCPDPTDPTLETFDSNGHEVEAWFQVMGTAMGAGTVAPTISYTDQSGNAGATATAQNWVTAMGTNRAIPFDRVAGDSGVRSIQAYQQTATQSSGVFSLVLRRRIATLRIPIANEVAILDWAALALAAIPASAHLEFVWFAAGGGGTNVQGELQLAQG